VSNDLTRIARPFMEKVAARINETVMLLQAYGLSAVCIESIESTRPVRLAFESGHTMPLGDGASAKLLLACMSPEERTAKLDERCAIDPAFAKRRRTVERELPQLAEQGWATSLAEVEEGVWACAALIRDGERVAGVITAAGPAFRIQDKLRDEVRDLLLAAATGVTRSLAAYR
jgi:DNA-binding IclR family transcriptional regulator